MKERRTNVGNECVSLTSTGAWKVRSREPEQTISGVKSVGGMLNELVPQP